MKTPRPLTRTRPSALLAVSVAAALALPGAARAQDPVPTPDCIGGGSVDANGDGFDDAFVSPRAVLVDAEVDCGAAIGAGTVIDGGAVVRANDGAFLISPTVGARSFVGDGARIEGATIGNGVIVLGGARIVYDDLENEPTTLGNRVFVGRDVLVTPGASGTEIGNRAILLRGATLRGGTYGPGLQVGAESEIVQIRTERNVRIGGGTTIRFDSFIESGARIGRDVAIDSEVLIGPRSVVGDGTVIGNDAEIEARAVIGENVTIAASARIGRGASVGDGATIEFGASVPAHAVVPPGDTVTGGR